MSLDPKNELYDGFESLEGGVDSGRVPGQIEKNKCVEATNVVFRGGRPTTRPGFRKIPLTFTNSDNTRLYPIPGEPANSPIVTTAEIAFKGHALQGASYFAPTIDSACLMASIGGRLFRLDVKSNSAEVTDVTPEERNPGRGRIAYMCQAEQFHITQDGDSPPIIYDGKGDRARRATTDEIPVGTAMAYGLGRLCLISGSYIYFGDIKGGDINAADPNENVLKFTETRFLAEGQPSSLHFSMGKPVSLCFIPQQDTGTGNGELLCLAQNGISSFRLSLPRLEWKDSPFQKIALLTVGARGHRGFCFVNGDIWYRAGDGYRSYREARAEIQGWARLPMSSEVHQYTELETGHFLDRGSVIHFNGRLIGTTGPVPNQGRFYHEGLLSLDFNVLSSFGEATKPAWDGYWNGIATNDNGLGATAVPYYLTAVAYDQDNQVSTVSFFTAADIGALITGPTIPLNTHILQVFTETNMRGTTVLLDNVIPDGDHIAFSLPTRSRKFTILVSGLFDSQERAFAFGLEGNENVLYEITKTELQDTDGPIPASLTTRAFNFGSAVTEKVIYGGDVWVEDVANARDQAGGNVPVSLSASYRNDRDPDFQPWHTFADFNSLGGGNCGFNLTGRPAYQPRKQLPKPPNVDDTTTRRVTKRFYEAQVKLEWIGHASIPRFRLRAQDPEERALAENSK